MASRYWVGGTASWDSTAGTKWSETSGGAGGASRPTSADDVFFDANSGTGTVTIASGNTGAKSITCIGFTGTLAGSTAITVSGSVTLDAGMTYSYTGVMTLNGSGTLTTAGKSLRALTINGSGITVELGDALVLTSSSITVTAGTFITNNYNVTANSLDSANTNTRAIFFGSSTLTFGTSTPISFVTNTNLTFDAGTSLINCTASSATLVGGPQNLPGVTFYNVAFTSTTAGTREVRSINTFNNLSVTAPSTTGVVQLAFNSSQTINGTLSTTGTAGNQRVWFRALTYGLAQTLTINGSTDLTDADFQDIYVVGTAAPISGTRISDLRGCSGITFNTPKTVYWVTAGGGNRSGDNWAESSGGTASTDYFPLAQDTAVIDNTGLNTSATITLDNTIPYLGTVDMSTRTNAMTMTGSTVHTIYGNWVNGSGTVVSGSNLTLTFSGRNTQTMTSAGKTFPGSITVDSYGGTVELVDALNMGVRTLTVTRGTFDTKNYNVTAGSISSDNSNVRTITLGSSTVTLSSGFGTQTSTNLTFNGGTSSINLTGSTAYISSSNQIFYNVTYSSVAAETKTLVGDNNTFNNLTVNGTTSDGLTILSISGDQTITGTLNVSGTSAVRRSFIYSSTLGTTRTLTVGTLAADDCDFRDITITGTAAGSSPTRAGDCGGNSGITFPSPKTVYWNLAGTQNWHATAWASSSGGTPDINNFPLAQDTAVFNDTGSAGTVTMSGVWNISTFDASARTSAMTISTSTSSPFVYGDWKFGTGVTSSSSTVAITFAKRGTQTITSNGVTFGCPVTVNSITGGVQLADALTLDSARTLTLTGGTFDPVTYNVTTGAIQSTTGTRILKMGSGTWTLTGTGTVWLVSNVGVPFYIGTADILLSNTSTSARTFAGGNLSYNKLTIGGTTGTSTLTITGNNQFTELASTKTVAHTIALGSTTQTFGKWTVTGTSGNVVTVTGTGTNHVIAGSATSGIDYLAMGSIGFSTTSPGEFYAGANSTGSNATIIKTAPPSPRTLYWVGGTGNWSDTARWSISSGGSGGEPIPTSLDDVVFDAASNAAAYTSTVNATSRCNKLTIAGPASGNVTLAGGSTLIIHDDVTLPATGLTRTYSGAVTLSGSTSGKVLTTNGVALNSVITLNGVNVEWTLGSAFNNSAQVNITNGLFDFDTYNFTTTNLSSDNGNIRTIDFGSGTTTFSASGSNLVLGTTETNAANLTITAGTSQINCSGITFSGNGKTFYNVAFTSASASTITINGANSFNDLSFAALSSSGIKNISLTADQTINGTFTCSAGTNAGIRNFVQSNTIGTTRTLTCATVNLTDVDFRDITITGAAAPATGTRLGDCKGNSGITFDTPKTVYWNLGGSTVNYLQGWATTTSGTPNINNLPLAQDTGIFGSNTATQVVMYSAYPVGTLQFTSNSVGSLFLNTNVIAPICGNIEFQSGSNLTISGGSGSVLLFSGRNSQIINTIGKIFAGNIALTVDSPGGTVTLQDNLTLNNASLTITSGTFDANGYNVTLNGSSSSISSSNSNVRTIAIGSGIWTIAGSVGWSTATSTNLTVTGTGTISLTSASSKIFSGGGIDYSGITLDQGGAGALTINGDNTFRTITNSYKSTGPTTITLNSTMQRITGRWGASGGGTAKVLTLLGSVTAPASLVFTGSGVGANAYNLSITGVRAYPTSTSWYAGSNSTNNGSLGWIFENLNITNPSKFMLLFM